MSQPLSFAAPLELTEKAKTTAGPMRVVIDTYPSGTLLVILKPETGKGGQDSSIEISSDMPESANDEPLARGEFAAADALLLDTGFSSALLKGNVFRSTGKRLSGKEIWSLNGLARIEFLSAFAPPIAASKASFPSHLFNDCPFDFHTQQTLIAGFEDKGGMYYSPQGESVWMLREYCEKNKIPFAIYMVKQEDEQTVGMLFCKKKFAQGLCENETQKGRSVQTIYESPLYL
jgi:hypothetical protein